MITEELKVKISVDTSELKKSVNEAKKTLTSITDSNDGIGKTTKGTSSEVDKLKNSINGLTKVTGFAVVTKTLTGVKKAIKSTVNDVKLAAEEFAGAFNFKNFDVGDDGLKGYLQSMKIQFKEAASTIKGTFVTALKAARNAIIGISASIAALIVTFSHLSESTREFREAMNQVNTSFISLGSNAETAQQAFDGFYRVLGEVDRSTEAANLLAQITTNEKELAQWTTIATGALAMFPDSLPTEGLIEASNETIKTAKVVGVLADALNWPANSANKISEALSGSTEAQKIFNEAIADGMTVEDAFNSVLAATNDETQREIILRASLNNIYAGSAALYEQMNKDIIAQNEAQNRLNQAMAKIGQITQPLQTAFTNLKATLANALAPAIQVVCNWLVTLVNWLSTAIAWVGAFISVLFPGVAIAEKISSAVGGVSNSLGSASGGAGGLADNLDTAAGSAEKLRRTLMGFDELNVVTDQTSSSGGSSGAGSGSGGASGGGLDVSGIDTGDSVFKKAQDQMEEFKEKIKAFMDEWGTQIKIIAASLAALTLAGLLNHLGQAIGLGDKFLAVMSNIKKLAVSAIVITLQYTLVNEFMDKFIDGDGIKNYILGLLTAAIGTGILYSMWGPAGLVIGLGVTAVASIKAVIDNGGIDSVESAVVALTGLASAIGAVVAAVKVFNLGTVLGDVGAFFTLLREGNGLVPTLAAAFPKLAGVVGSIGTAFSGIGTAVTGALSAIGGLIGGGVAAGLAIVAAAVAAVVSVVVFLKENWEAVTQAVKNFFEVNIAPKLDTISESFGKIKDALVKVGNAIWDAIPQSWKDFLEEVATAIGKVVTAIADWFKSVDWIQAIGKAFETVGGIIFSAVTGVIAGAISTLVTLIEGVVGVVTGIVEIVSGVIEAIVGIITLDGEKIKEGALSIVNGVIDVFKGLWTGTVGAVVEFVQGVIDWFTSLWDELVGHSIVPDMINAIIEWFLKLPSAIFGKLQEFVDGVIQKFKDMWTNVSTATTQKLGEIRTGIMNGWNNIKSYFTSNIAPKFTLAYWQNKFDTIRSAIQEKLGAARTQVINSWNNVKSYFTTNIAPKFTLTYWKNKFDTIRAAASEKLTAAKTVITNTWNTVKNWFSSNVAPKFTVSYWTQKFNSIKDGARAAFNGVISVVESAVNGIIRKINTLSWKIPDWVPKFGGDRFGFNLSTISIPRLATGGIAMRSTIANIGENGREAVLPLDNNTGWMDALADKIAARNSSPSKIVLKVGERELGWAAINGINNVTKQTGGLQLQLI